MCVFLVESYEDADNGLSELSSCDSPGEDVMMLVDADPALKELTHRSRKHPWKFLDDADDIKVFSQGTCVYLLKEHIICYLQ